MASNTINSNTSNDPRANSVAISNNALREQPINAVSQALSAVPKEKDLGTETQKLEWTSRLNLETLTLGAVNTCFDLTTEQIIIMLLALKVSALAIPALLSILPVTTFLISAGAIVGVLILLLLATMAYKAYSTAKNKAAELKALELEAQQNSELKPQEDLEADSQRDSELEIQESPSEGSHTCK